MKLRVMWGILIVMVGYPIASQDRDQDFSPVDNTYLLEEVLVQTGTQLQWDPYRRQGALVRGSRLLTFSLREPVAVENLFTVHPVQPPTRDQGSLRFGADFLALARRVFPPQEQTRRISAIFIDPGHGGRDPGAVGSHAISGQTETLMEKDVVLSVARRLAAQLRARYPDKEIVLSRDTDVYLTLEDRTTIANQIEAGNNESVIFISVHANASLNRNARGFEVWFLPPEFRRRNLVSQEDTGVEDPDILSILNTMREEEITLESVLLARNVLSGLEGQIGELSPNRGLREESWYVVRNAKMPSILVEVGFVTNEREFLRLQEDSYLQSLSQGIYTGVTNFVRNFEEVGLE
ncbi:MAG TPA: N-acetylmuramoyl-L-alanine amidase [Alkalispirochaeta sp.]|nr:N-acetylmuramoyl-L-alanine amidase [Alkalispirochaeta sp.]